MALRDRLDRLRRSGASGADGSAPVPTAREPSFAERVAALQAPRARARPRETLDSELLAARLAGRQVAPGLIEIQYRQALDSAHGAVALARLREPLDDLVEVAGIDPARFVFIDTETSGLSGGSGTVVFLLGLARIHGDELVVHQWLLTGFAGEPALLEAAAVWLRDDDVLVSFNGKSFDVPLLTARCRLAGRSDPFADRLHVDLLHPTRRCFARRWEDCRLQSAERNLLGFHRRDDLPGSEAPMVWFEMLQWGRAERVPRVVEHNRWDLISLAALLPALAGVHGDTVDPLTADALGLARHWLQQGAQERALQALEQGLRYREDAATMRELARLYRRRGQWAEACALWRRLVEREACEESTERLAKYYEHQRRDYRTALEFARRLPAGQPHEQRRQRLRAKLRQRALD